jgi:murein DD-endopeptidase MepM/ murein hydrolase activator NlpD
MMILRILAATLLSTLLCACVGTAPPASTPEPGLQPLAPLNSGPFPVEVIEAHAGFLAPLARSDGRLQMSYELHLLNQYRRALRLVRIEIVDTETPERVVASFGPAYLNEHFTRNGRRPQTGELTLQGNTFGIANLWLDLPADAVPGLFHHRLFLAIDTQDGGARTLEIETARVRVPAPTSVALAPPFDPGNWFFMTDNHRDTRILTEGAPSYAQRFATDWARVERSGSFTTDAPDGNEAYLSYGMPVRAVADGVIRAIRDDIPDNDPDDEGMAVPITRDTIAGNYVMLGMKDDLNAVYAHLIPGSLEVKVGDRVQAGDVLGKLGNSGNSDGPHLHFHVETRTPLGRPLSGEGVPYMFQTYRAVETYSVEEAEKIFEANHLPEAPTPSETRTDELPLGIGVVEF